MTVILDEQTIRRDKSLLERAWSDVPTFALLPTKSPMSLEWIHTTLETLPEEWQEKHFILVTSGSTGQPKLVVGMRDRAEAMVHQLHLRQQSEALQSAIVVLPIFYCYAFVNQWLWSHLYHKQLILTPGFGDLESVRLALTNAQEAQICFVGVHVPLLEHHFQGMSFPGVRRVHFAGSRFPQGKLDLLGRIFPNATVFNNYGCTEAMPRLALREADSGSTASDVGQPLAGITFQTDSSGELFFRSPYSAVGWLDGSGIHRITPDQWIATGDLGKLEADGRLLWQGRASEVFKRHGQKVSLSNLLDTVNAHWPGSAAFYREADPRGEEGHVLVVSPHPSEDERQSILQQFRAHYPRSQWPLRIESVETFPLLANGKVDTRSLADCSGKVVQWHQRI